MFSFPDEFMASLLCGAQRDLIMSVPFMYALLAWLFCWLAMRAARALARRASHNPATLTAPLPTPALFATAATNPRTPSATPTPSASPSHAAAAVAFALLLALQWRGLALLLTLIWALGLLRAPWRQTPRWSNSWARTACTGLALLVLVVNLAQIKMGCVV